MIQGKVYTTCKRIEQCFHQSALVTSCTGAGCKLWVRIQWKHCPESWTRRWRLQHFSWTDSELIREQLLPENRDQVLFTHVYCHFCRDNATVSFWICMCVVGGTCFESPQKKKKKKVIRRFCLTDRRHSFDNFGDHEPSTTCPAFGIWPLNPPRWRSTASLGKRSSCCRHSFSSQH